MQPGVEWPVSPRGMSGDSDSEQELWVALENWIEGGQIDRLTGCGEAESW